MRARAIRDLLQLNDSGFFRAVAEGLHLIIGNVGRLHDGSVVLSEAQRFHSSRVLAAIAEEETAKFLILLDAVRCPRLPEGRFSTQLARFNDHLAKGIYVRACMMRPSSLHQLQEYVDHYRQDLYLDGPNDVDWVFRNEVMQERESVLYVDYISSDEGHSWTDPAQFEELLHAGPREPLSLQMAKALFDVGISTSEALSTVAQVWRSASIRPDTSWNELRSLNQRTLEELESHGLLQEQPDATYAWVINEWQFPMYDLDLTLTPVNVETLRERQRNWSPGW